jgi:hypothetical protein
MAKRRPKPACHPTQWFISASRPLGHPHCGYWEFWDGEKWAGEFSKALLFADAEECARVAERVHAQTGVSCMTHAVGPAVGGCFLALNQYGKFWTGTGWVELWEEARQWTASPVVGENMVRCQDPWQACHDECERVRAAEGCSCNVACVPESSKVKRQQRRFPAPDAGGEGPTPAG